jgi:glutathionyl-hydroquinone reductase
VLLGEGSAAVAGLVEMIAAHRIATAVRTPAFVDADTTKVVHPCGSHRFLNPSGIVRIGPDRNFDAPVDRGRL